jgi:hypothetical protein
MNSAPRKILLAALSVGILGVTLAARTSVPSPSGKAMQEAAVAFLEVLPPESRAQAMFAFDDAERLNWHFIPRERKGLALRDLQGPALEAAKRLIKTGLSAGGYEQVEDVMSLEEVLFLLESGDRTERRERRHPGKYYLSVFGMPRSTGRWGWRLEGHHLSLNYTIADGNLVSSTPEFLGANPGELAAPPDRSRRVLGPREDLARQIFKLCTPEQKSKALIDPAAPDDIRGANIAQPDTTAPVGLPYNSMSPQQQELLQKLIGEYVNGMPGDVAEERLSRLKAAGVEGVYFAWWGGPERHDRHAYRIQGPSFLVEYNNTQSNANHVHSIWRDLSGDFGIPLSPAAR